MVSQIVLTVVINTVFMGILAFAAQKLIEQRLNRSLEEFKANLQSAVSERKSWWELKKETYSEIMTALVELQRCCRRWLDDLYEVEELDAQSSRELNEAYLHAKECLTKVAATGAYIVSEDTIVTLEELLHELDKHEYYSNGMTPDIYAWMHERHREVRNSKARVREYAKADLLEH